MPAVFFFVVIFIGVGNNNSGSENGTQPIGLSTPVILENNILQNTGADDNLGK